MKKREKERRKVMSSIRSLTLVVLIAALAAVVGCKATSAELQPVEIDLNGVDVVYGGDSAIVLEADFTVRNPNDYQVVVKDPEYEFWTGDMNLGGKKVSITLYVPGGTTVNFKSAVGVVTFKWLVVPLLLKGNSPGKAAVSLLPLWKSLGGALPNPKLKKLWDKTKAKGTGYKATGRVTIAGGAEEMMVEFSSPL